MDNKKILLALFLIVALIQLYVPASMILDREDIIETGTEYKFETQPLDPEDPFRGKYIRLRFDNEKVYVKNIDEWERHEVVYLKLKTNDAGFAEIYNVVHDRPDDTSDYLALKINYISTAKSYIDFDFPFDRYYMEEFKAKEAENLYIESLRDTDKVTYAVVSVKDGDFVLTDVQVDGISIKDLVKSDREGSD